MLHIVYVEPSIADSSKNSGARIFHSLIHLSLGLPLSLALSFSQVEFVY